MRVLAVDVGGTSVKILASGQKAARRFPSGPKLTPPQMVAGVQELARDWKYDVVAIGYPGRVHEGHITTEPRNLAPRWVGFDFAAAFGHPVRIMNDAAMQALGSYKQGLLLFLGLGTGLGAALVAHGVVIPMELAHLSLKNGTYEHYMGVRALKRLGPEEMAEVRRVWSGPADRGAAPRRRGAWGREREEVEGAAERLPRRRQLERPHWRLSAVGESVDATTARPGTAGACSVRTAAISRTQP